MKKNLNKERILESYCPDENAHKILLITGARQTGKTTLTQKKYSMLPYINLDAIENRDKIQQIETYRWGKDIGPSIIDEAQKSPPVFEKIKYAYDAQDIHFSVLLGSSQILLLKKIRESLAGRISIFELYPLTLSELFASEAQPLQPPLLDLILKGEQALSNILKNIPHTLFGETETLRKEAQAHLLAYGGMPSLLHLPQQERYQWLRDYELSYFERDLADLARLSDLQPFKLFQKLAALRTGCLLNYSELARDASLSVDTAKRYIEYLKLSYQVELLQPYYKNLTRSAVKTPKIYWIDIGILRILTGFQGDILTGQLYETFVVSEIIKYIKTIRSPVEYYFYRTHSGFEIDLLLQTPQGLLPIEIKARQDITIKDIKPMLELKTVLKDEWIGGLVIYNGNHIKKIADTDIWAIPAWRLLS